jgi:tetratricopeptide (TPR) repeat protein
MTIVFRLLTAFLVVCLMAPRLAQAGGDAGMNPYEIGEKYFARKDYRIALKHYRKALAKNDVRAHYRMGLIYERTGKDRDALSHYQRFTELGPPDAQRSDAVLRAKAVEERLKRKTTRKTTRPTGLLGQGKSLYMKGKYREAEQALLQAAARNESQPEVHFYLGEVYMKLEAYGKAEAEYTKAKGYY